jgi:hypothetical protein
MNHRWHEQIVPWVVVVITLVGFLSVGAGAVQVAQTYVSTSTSTAIVTTTLPTTTASTMIATSTQYSLTTIIVPTTITEGTLTTTTTSTTTLQTITPSTSVSTALGFTSTVTSTRYLSVLANTLGEFLIGLVALGALASLAPHLIANLRRGIICRECGYQNSPFARMFCTRCGKPLRR